MKTVLHITAHMGGGGGKVLSGIAAFAQKNNGGYRHKIVLMEQPEKMNFIDICRDNHIDISVVLSREGLVKTIREADIVQVEWWHHPLITGLLASFPKVKARLIVWSHVSGCYYPYIPENLLSIPERFVFTSQYSFDNPYWPEETKLFAQKHCQMVNSSGGFSHIDRKRIEHQGFNVGYIGTQSYAKLNVDFVDYCSAVSAIEGIRFTMVGDQTNKAAIADGAKRLGIADKFTFIDYVGNVNNEFAKFDVFGYLLNPRHFGTTENVLLEAMAAGLPVVCLDQCAERYLIAHNETGLLVKNKDEYQEAVMYLYNNPAERERLGNNGRKFVLEQFAVKKTVEKLYAIYDEVMKATPRVYDFMDVLGTAPYQVFLRCLPIELRKAFARTLTEETNEDKTMSLLDGLPVILKEKSKSSIEQFSRIFPEDKVLRYWYSLLGNTMRQ